MSFGSRRHRICLRFCAVTPALIFAALLAGCQSEEEVKAEWIKFCVTGKFEPAQCEVLYSVKKSSDDAAMSASIASINSGVAMGMAAGRGGR